MLDLIVIGGGPAGYLAAERAGRGGLKTVLAEISEPILNAKGVI